MATNSIDELRNAFAKKKVKEEVKKEETKEPSVNKEGKKEPSYRNTRGRSIIKADGTKMKEVNGHYTPKTDEERALCIYFTVIGNLVEVK